MERGDNHEVHARFFIKSFIKKYMQYYKETRHTFLACALIRPAFLNFRALFHGCHISFQEFKSLFHSVHVDIITNDLEKFKILCGLALLRKVYLRDKSAGKQTNLGSSPTPNATVNSTLTPDLTYEESVKSCRNKDNSVIMQLNIGDDDDAVIITKNESESDDDNEPEGVDLCCSPTQTGSCFSVKQVVKADKSVHSRHPMFLSSCKCKLKCPQKISAENRSQIHNSFWAMGDYRKQKIWIKNHIQTFNLEKQQISSFAYQNISTSCVSFVLDDSTGKLVPVCDLFFQGTLGLISRNTKKSPLRKAKYLLNPSVTQQAVDISIEQHVRRHCLKANVQSAHQIFKSRQSIRKLHSDFIKCYHISGVSYEAYEGVFKSIKKLYTSSGISRRSKATKQLSPGSAHSKVSDAAGNVNEKCDYEATPPQVRRSSRQTRMQGSMAEEDLIEMTEDSNFMSGFSTYRDSEPNQGSDLLYGWDEYPSLGQKLSAGASSKEEVFNKKGSKKRKRRQPAQKASLDAVVSEPLCKRLCKASLKSNTSKCKAKGKNNHITIYEKYGRRTDDKTKDKHFTHNNHSKFAPLKKKHRHPLLPSCHCTRRKCYEKISEEQRRSIHASFWNLKSYKDRKRWLMRYVETRAPKCKAVTLIPPPRKKHGSKKYFFPNGQGAVIEVCRLFFLHTLGFRWDSVVDTIAKTKKPTQPVASEERALKKKPAHEIPEHIVGSVLEYLESVKASVETKANNKQEDIGGQTESENLPGLKSKNLFADYKLRSKHLKFNLGYHSFRRIFLSFAVPENIHASDKDDGDNEGSSAHSDIDPVDDDDVVVDRKLPSSSGFACVGDSASRQDANNEVTTGDAVCPKFKLTRIMRKSNLKRSAEKCERIDNRSESISDNFDRGGSGKQTSEGAPANSKDTVEAKELSELAQQNPNMNETQECILDVGNGFFKPPVDKSSNNSGSYLYTTELKYKKRSSKSKRNDGKNYPVLPPCKCTKRKCAEKFSETDRKAVNDMFWGLGGYNERKQWILEHIKRADIKRRIASRQGPPRKLESRWYYLPDGMGDLVDVCKAFFLRTLGYKWDSVIDTIGKTTPKGDKYIVPDRRGRKPPPHKISDEAVNSMTLYIESACQTYQPLYQQKGLGQKKGGKSTSVSLIPYGLTMKQLFEDYKTKHPNHTFGYESFRKVFKRVHSSMVANLPPGQEAEEESEPLFTSAPRLLELGCLAPVSAEAKPDFQTEPTHSVADNRSYAGLNHYTPSPPHPPTQQQPIQPHLQHVPNPPDRKSCLYQCAVLPREAQQESCQMSENGPESLGYNSNEQDSFLKYKHSVYGAQANMAAQPSHYPQMSEPVGYSLNSNPCPEVTDLMTNGAHNHNQFPSYLMPNAEPLRRQAYHQMASQYQSILHHIAESSRFLNYGGFPPAEAAPFPTAQERPYHFNSRPEFQRDDVGHYNSTKNSQSYEAPSMPMSYSLPCHLPHTSSQIHVSDGDVSPYSDDNSFFNDAGNSQNYCVIKDPMQSGSIQDSALNNSRSVQKSKKSSKKNRPSKKAENNSAKVKKEKKTRPKSTRNFGEHYPLLPPCNCKKKKCTEKFSESRRQQIHDLFWRMNNYNDRKQWMLHNIKREDCKRRRVDQPESTRKSESRWYYLPNEEGHQLEVCKDFFLRTLGYKWDSVIDTIRKTTPKGETSTRPDMRGKKSPAHKLSGEILKSVIQYIESMQQTAQPYKQRPQVPGDLEDSRRENDSGDHAKVKNVGGVTIPYGLTMKDLFDDYKAKHASHKIGYESFRRIFKALSNSEKILDSKGNEVHGGTDAGALPF